MTITPEQFKKIIKETVSAEFIPFEKNISEKIDNVLNAVDKISKKFEDHESEHIANLGAHDRFQEEIDYLKNQNVLKVRRAK